MIGCPTTESLRTTELLEDACRELGIKPKHVRVFGSSEGFLSPLSAEDARQAVELLERKDRDSNPRHPNNECYGLATRCITNSAILPYLVIL